MYSLYRYIILLMAVAMVGCSDSDSFTVKGVVEGNPTMNLRAVYYGNDALQTVITPVRDGKFEFKGCSRQPTVVELFDNDYRLMGRLCAANGDEVECVVDRANPNRISLKGTPAVEGWSQWLKDNEEVLAANDRAAVNSAVRDYVEQNRESVVSSLLIVTAFDASTPSRAATADSLLTILDPAARPQSIVGSFNMMLQRTVDPRATDDITSLTYRTRTDSIEIFVPEHQRVALLAFTDEYSDRADSLVPALKRLSERGDRVKLLDYSLVPDTFTWARIVRRDSAAWTQGWRPGGVSAPGVDRLCLPRLPYYIVVDSAGRQVYRGTSVAQAEDAVINKLK